MTEETLHEGVAFLMEPFLRNIFALSHNSTGCLLFICNYVVAIIRYSTTRYTPYFLFDSHCRNSCGITDSPFVFSVLLQFADLIQKERYIEEFYNVANLAYPSYFQVQFISVNVDDLNLSSIQACQVWSIKRKERLQKSSADVLKKKNKTRENKKRKSEEKMRITRLKNVNSFQGSDKSSGKSDRVRVFKEFIKSGPCLVCIVCNRCLYRKSVAKFSENR